MSEELKSLIEHLTALDAAGKLRGVGAIHVDRDGNWGLAAIGFSSFPEAAGFFKIAADEMSSKVRGAPVVRH